MTEETTIQQDVSPNVSTEQQIAPLSKMDFDNPDPNINYIPDDKYNEMVKSAPVNIEQTSKTDQPQSTESSSSSFDIEKFLAEKTNGKISKLDDLESLVNNQVKFEDDTSASVYEMIQQGKYDELNSFLTQQQILSSVDKLSAEDAIKLKMRIEDPEADDEDIIDDFELRFPKPDYDMMSEEEAAKAKKRYERSLKNSSKDAVEFLSNLKKEIKLPAIKRQDNVFDSKQLEDDYAQLTGKINSSVVDALGSLEKISLSIDDKQQGVVLNHDYMISEQDKSALSQRSVDFFTDFQNRYGQGDKYDGAKLAKEMFILDNFEKIVKSAAMSAYNQGKLDKAMKTANINFNPEGTRAIDTDAEAKREAIRNFLRS